MRDDKGGPPVARRRRTTPVTWLVVLWALAGAVGAAADITRGPSEALEAVERSGFSMALPPWTVEIDDDTGASGRHVRTDGPRRAEVSWYLHPDDGLEPFDAALQALQEGYGMQVAERTARPEADPPRLEALLDYGGRAWFFVVQLACADVGVAVSLTVVMPTKDEARALSQRMLETFRCRSAELPRLVERWPDSDLPPAFGLSLEGSPVLVHADGRWVMVARQAPETVRGMVADSERAQRVLAGYGAALGDTWSLAGGGEETRNLSGLATAWPLASALLGAVAASGFACGEGKSAFLVFAGDDTGGTAAPALAALAARFGCPGATAAPPVTERPSACEVGVADFCEAP